jgi:glycine cleavage system protein P-like pyridoxal-binding family
MQVVVVACDKNGNIDLADLRAKAEQAGENLLHHGDLPVHPRRV